jgi:LysR family transcriptional regulator of gallate degradation
MNHAQSPPDAQPGAAQAAFQLNLRHLRGLTAVHEHGSISAAAGAVGLSQPALTQGILKLEKLMGEVLFERRPDGIVPTAAGELVVDRARACLAHLATGTRQVGGTAFEPDRRLSMTQLRAFVALVRAGSISAAAADLGLSQPAVHRAVRELEEALGRKLVERRGRGVHVNFAGRRFARSCRLALAELQAAFSELGRDPHNPTIALGTTPLARGFLVPEAMALMVAERFPAGFRVHEGSWGELVEALRDGVIDIIVGEIPDDAAPDLATHPLYEEAPVVVAGRQHPLATRRSCTPQMLASYPWIIAPENSPLRAEWERLFADRPPRGAGGVRLDHDHRPPADRQRPADARHAGPGGAAGAHRPAQLHRRTAGGKQADGRRHDAQELAPHAGPAAVPRTADGGFRRHWRRREPAVAHRALLDLKAAATTVGPAQFRFLNTAAAFRITRRPALPRIGRIDVRFNHSP